MCNVRCGMALSRVSALMPCGARGCMVCRVAWLMTRCLHAIRAMAAGRGALTSCCRETRHLVSASRSGPPAAARLATSCRLAGCHRLRMALLSRRQLLSRVRGNSMATLVRPCTHVLLHVYGVVGCGGRRMCRGMMAFCWDAAGGACAVGWLSRVCPHSCHVALIGAWSVGSRGCVSREVSCRVIPAGWLLALALMLD